MVQLSCLRGECPLPRLSRIRVTPEEIPNPFNCGGPCVKSAHRALLRFARPPGTRTRGPLSAQSGRSPGHCQINLSLHWHVRGPGAAAGRPAARVDGSSRLAPFWAREAARGQRSAPGPPAGPRQVPVPAGGWRPRAPQGGAGPALSRGAGSWIPTPGPGPPGTGDKGDSACQRRTRRNGPSSSH